MHVELVMRDGSRGGSSNRLYFSSTLRDAQRLGGYPQGARILVRFVTLRLVVDTSELTHLPTPGAATGDHSGCTVTLASLKQTHPQTRRGG